MIQLRTALVSLGALACSGLMASAAGAETHRLGTVGVTFESGAWERRTLSPDSGGDQFQVAGSNVYLIVLEQFALFEQRADFVSGLETFLSRFQSAAQEVEADPEVTVERYGPFTRATARITGLFSGLHLHYQLELVSTGDGVGYVFLGWTGASQPQELQAAMDEILQSLRFPGPGSEWFEKAQPTRHAYGFEGWTIELSFRDSVFAATDSEPQERYSLTADAGLLAVHLFVEELTGDADAVLTLVKEAAAGEVEYDELVRSDLELESGNGRELLMRSRSQPPYDFAIAVVDLGDGRWIDLRMVTQGPTGHRQEIWNRLLASLRAEREAPLDAFPVVESEPDAGEGAFLTDPARHLLEASRRLAELSWSPAVDVGPQGDLLVRDDDQVRRIPAAADDPGEAASAVLYRSDDHLSGMAVAWGSETLLVEGGEEVRWVVDGELHPAGFRADRAAAWGDSLLLARSGETRSLLGLGALPVVGASELVKRTPAGEERPLLKLPDRRVDALAARGRRALVATAPRSAPGDRDGAAVELLLVDTDEGTSRPLERWRAVERIVAVAGGWLVSGSGPDGAEGVVLLGGDGARELLVSGGAVGLAMDDLSLTFLVDRCLGEQGSAGYCVYRAPLAAVRAHGPGFWPFGVRLLNEVAGLAVARVGGAAGPSLLPETREEIAGLVAAAEAVTRELTGWPLPTSSDGVDALLGELAWEREVSRETVTLLVALAAEALLRDGAAWVPAAEPAPAGPGSTGWEVANAHAVGLHPAGLVRSTLFDSEGWYHPLAEVGRQARGRTLLVGTDAARLREAVRAADLAELQDRIREGAAEPLVDLLAAHRDNLFLRDHVYRQLAAFGWEERLAAVAAPFAAADDAAPIDLVAAAAGRLAGELSPAGVDALIEELRSAIERAPGEAALYLLLGSAYERSAAPDRLGYARTCYQKAAAMTRWGHVAEAAQEALQRIAE